MSALDKEWSELLSDLEKGFELLRTLPPAVTFFGGARIREDDPFYVKSQEIGELLAAKGIPPRTGAGPGIMTSVPEGYKSAPADDVRCKTGAFSRAMVAGYVAGPRTRRFGRPSTQGIKIFLPFEPETNAAIDHSVELISFPIRRLMLYENALAIVVFPGGIGTLDELFEVWARRSAGLHSDPIVLFGCSFYGPILEAVTRVMRDGSRDLLTVEESAAVSLTDDPHAVLLAVTGSELRGFDEAPEDIARRLAQEIPFVAGALKMSLPALTLLGGVGLRDGDPALAVARGVLERLSERRTAVRVGSGGPLAQAAYDAYVPGECARQLQGFFLRGSDVPAEWGGCARLDVTDPLAHKLLLTQNSVGFLALPGRIQTLDEVFSVLCEMQTGKRERAPFVLIGSDFWTPIVEACEQVMLTADRQTISPDDFRLFQVVDDVESALAALA